MFTSFLVVFLIEPTHQFLKDGAHAVVVDAVGGEVDLGIEELADQGAQSVGFGESGQLVAELEVIDDVLNVGGKAVQVVFEISEKLLLGSPERRSLRVNLEVL